MCIAFRRDLLEPARKAFFLLPRIFLLADFAVILQSSRLTGLVEISQVLVAL